MILGDGDLLDLAGLQQGLKVAVPEPLRMRLAQIALHGEQNEHDADKVPEGKVLLGVHVVERNELVGSGSACKLGITTRKETAEREFRECRSFSSSILRKSRPTVEPSLLLLNR